MRILWLVNILPFEFSKKVGKEATFLGGWIESMSSYIKQLPNIELAIACKSESVSNIKEVIDNIVYYTVNYSARTKRLKIEQRLNEILKDFKPDIVQIEGTEFPHARAMINIGKSKAIVSLQGILSGQYAYQCGEIHVDDLITSFTPWKLYAGWTMHWRKKHWYKKRMINEKSTIEKAQYLIGRTTWDRAHSYALNPRAKYFSCARVLRKPFYEKQWSVEKRERHSVYIGNAYSALKGAHYMIEAAALLLREFPDLKIYIANTPPFAKKSGLSALKNGYATYLKHLIKKLNVEHSIVFTGALSAEQVADRLSRTHVYVLCSTIENSPNTLGEAMMVGTPCVASYVGGVPDMAADGKEALFFRSGDPVLLAWNIKRVFEDDNLAQALSKNARNHALATHDPTRNAEQLVSIYKQVMEDE